VTQLSPEYRPPEGFFHGPPGPRQQRTNGFAIAALVLGIAGGGLLALIFGFIALGQVNKRGEKGKSMAVIAIVLGVAWSIAACAFVGFLANSPSDSGGGKKVTALKVGDCIVEVVDRYATEVDLVSCQYLHDAEVFGLSGVTAATYPGNAELTALAEARCAQMFRLDVDAARQNDPSIRIAYLIPSADDWDTPGAHRIVCLAESTGLSLSGSILKSGS
jgi:hypothetical protein